MTTDDATSRGQGREQLISRAEGGDPAAAEELMPLVYDELRRLAHHRMLQESPGISIQTTELVHEAYLRLLGDDVRWDTRGHFFGAAARSMRRILVDRARSRNAAKRGGGQAHLDIGRLDVAADTQSPELILALDEALHQLADRDSLKAEIVSLRFFAGLTIEQTALALGLGITTVKDHWQFARAWLGQQINRVDEPAK